MQPGNSYVLRWNIWAGKQEAVGNRGRRRHSHSHALGQGVWFGQERVGVVPLGPRAIALGRRSPWPPRAADSTQSTLSFTFHPSDRAAEDARGARPARARRHFPHCTAPYRRSVLPRDTAARCRRRRPPTLFFLGKAPLLPKSSASHSSKRKRLSGSVCRLGGGRQRFFLASTQDHSI